jgi:hypothetical protein
MRDFTAEVAKIKARSIAAVEARGLVSLMNATRWQALVDGIYARLPFPPAFQYKGVEEAAPDPETFEQDVEYHGAWSELWPFIQVEWLRVRPRWRKHRGQLVAPEIIDCTAEFMALVRELRVPHRIDGESIWIYGHAASTASIVQG